MVRQLQIPQALKLLVDPPESFTIRLMIKTPLRISCLLAVTCAAALAQDGWIDLFNGKNTDGWVQHGGKAKYTVQDGMLVGSTVLQTPNSFLCTKELYGDFVLELDFKVDPALNSGVQIRSECFDQPQTFVTDGKTNKIAAGRVHGYQVEIDMDPVKKRWWSGGLYDEGRRGWLYPGIRGGEAKTFTEQGAKISKQNDWNHFKVEAKGDTIKTWLNGEPRAEIKDSMTPKGFIALQVHSVGGDAAKEGIKAQWRNIRLKKLD